MQSTVVPASFDLPTVVEVVRGKDGFQNFGRMLELRDVPLSVLDAYEADLTAIEAHVALELRRARVLVAAERDRREATYEKWVADADPAFGLEKSA